MQALIYFQPPFISDWRRFIYNHGKSPARTHTVQYGLQIGWAICLTADQWKQQVTLTSEWGFSWPIMKKHGDWCCSGSIGDTLAMPPKIWALCETQTLTWNFPSSAAAEFRPALLLFSVSESFFYSSSLLVHISYIVCLFITLSYSWLHLTFPKFVPKRPQALIYLSQPTDPYFSGPIRSRAKLCSFQMVCSFSSTSKVSFHI